MGETHTVVLVYNVDQQCLPVKSQHAAHPVCSEKKVGTRTTGGAVLVAAALESAAAQQKQKQVYVAAIVTAARHIHGTRVRSVSLCVCLVDQPP